MKKNDRYQELLFLFKEFRERIKPAVNDGVPDFTAAAMDKQFRDLKQLQNRLDAVDISDWAVPRQVDYHVVRAEMNGVEFDHRVLRQWARDPGFYNLSDGIYPRLLVHHSRSLSDWGLTKPESPLSQKELEGLINKLQAVPRLFAQAKQNLTEAAGDLATIAIRVKEKVFRNDELGVADPTFFQMFTFPFISGDPKTALKHDNSIVITESASKKYFGKENPLGKMINIHKDFKVTAVIKDIPKNSHLKFKQVSYIYH